MSIDVLIVGAGPTGLLLAAELARYGIKLRLVDKNPEASKTSKAIGVFARTLEIFDNLGVVQEAIQCGRKLYAANLYDDGRSIAHININKLDSFFQFVLSLPQSETERILGKLVESLGVKIERSVTFTSLEQDTDGVTATLCHSDGREERCRAAWLVGCDGAHSSVRKAAGLAYEGVDITSLFVLADGEVDLNLSPHEIHLFFSLDGLLGAFPLPQENHWRVIANLPADTELPENPDAKLFEQLLAERSHLSTHLTNPKWLSKVNIRQRKVEQCRQGRVFVAGDALASHSPVGAQGMNTGLQDAHNLAWKMALVIRGEPTYLLDSYQAEREPVSKFLLTATEWATREIVQTNPTIKFLRHHLAGFVTSFDGVQQGIGNTLSELNINYRQSLIVQEEHSFFLPSQEGLSLVDWFNFQTGPKAGDRTPDVIIQTMDGAKRLFHVLSHLKHNLLLFDGKVTNEAHYTKLSQLAQDIEKNFRDFIDVHIVLLKSRIPQELEWRGSILLDPQAECHQRYSAGGECLYLIRLRQN
jgi:2-polyprenyl-6-methoxyphenol hydroxylase-like FAD-dependent oxidoreductase